MHDWLQALRAATVSGSTASVLSTMALSTCSRIETDNAVVASNAPSQWIWGRKALRARGASLRYTAVGYAVHHLTSVFWATFYEKRLGGRPAESPARLLAEGLRTAAIACFVDYTLTPRRLRPGFEQHLTKGSLALVYAAFGIGLTLPRIFRLPPPGVPRLSAARPGVSRAPASSPPVLH